ncbi:hypothetical protein CDL15_Pgr022710 [Punica granatum]|uniref:E3 ubiquitin-protein ligase WAV3-like n=1 Tax=Punica granatum TaxID=22663 RepID=A0A218XS15_PUNGR|nr:hypothetical protein CDL15_Pgr022710 [Punica granatum]PKI74588.1 hypothetical protein CRG98_004915 [Punica granatum]
MGSKWRKAKLALGLNLCVYVPRTLEDSPPDSDDASTERLSDAALLSPGNWDAGHSRPMTPTPSSHGLRFSRSASKSSKQTCSICLTKIKQGGGHAIFTAECSHSFHFHCIASSVKHGNQICPVCRAKWKEIPSHAPCLDLPPPLRGAPTNPARWANNEALVTNVRRLPPTQRDTNRRHIVPLFQAPEPGVFDDDELLDHHQPVFSEKSSSNDLLEGNFTSMVEIKTYPEVSAVPRAQSYDNFTVLAHLKAVPASKSSNQCQAYFLQAPRTPRAPVDLVTVLDISGSMAGTKLALLKRAMGFVIQNLSSSDRLSVIAFSSTARRLFPLRRMTDIGRQQALQAVNSLVANGGTNIAEGLRKGAKVMSDRKQKNPVASIILLSDGQDTYTVNNSGDSESKPNYQLLLPLSIHGADNTGFQIPVHAFGFGTDHDASSMHSISEISGGTFSFIETEAAIQDAFAQCIGGLLSVVVQELQVSIESAHPSVRLSSLRVGSYPSRVLVGGQSGVIDVGDLYADEERDFLITINLPVEASNSETGLLKVRCIYRDPLTKEMVTIESEEVRVKRPETAEQEAATVSMEVDRQKNRLQAALAMSQARTAAEQGDLAGAASILENCRRVLAGSVSAKSGDRLCVALDAELKEIQERMASRHVYEASGRAYILSGLSSHSWQRATARGDSTDGSSLVQAYQTPSMTEMLTRSQAMLLGSPSTQRLIQPLWSLGSQPNPR